MGNRRVGHRELRRDNERLYAQLTEERRKVQALRYMLRAHDEQAVAELVAQQTLRDEVEHLRMVTAIQRAFLRLHGWHVDEEDGHDDVDRSAREEECG